MIIDKIEKLRIRHNKRKTVLAKDAGISVGMYYKYVNGSPVPYDVAERMLTALGYKLIITVEI